MFDDAAHSICIKAGQPLSEQLARPGQARYAADTQQYVTGGWRTGCARWTDGICALDAPCSRRPSRGSTAQADDDSFWRGTCHVSRRGLPITLAAAVAIVATRHAPSWPCSRAVGMQGIHFFCCWNEPSAPGIIITIKPFTAHPRCQPRQSNSLPSGSQENRHISAPPVPPEPAVAGRTAPDSTPDDINEATAAIPVIGALGLKPSSYSSRIRDTHTLVPKYSGPLSLLSPCSRWTRGARTRL